MVTFISAKEFKINADKDVSWTLDGEYGGSHDKVVVENLNKQLQIMVPEEHVRDLTAEPEAFAIEKKEEASGNPDEENPGNEQ